MTNTASLEDGFYWVRVGQHWVVSQRVGKIFYTPWERMMRDELDEIDPRPIKREDVK